MRYINIKHELDMSLLEKKGGGVRSGELRVNGAWRTVY